MYHLYTVNYKVGDEDETSNIRIHVEGRINKEFFKELNNLGFVFSSTDSQYNHRYTMHSFLEDLNENEFKNVLEKCDYRDIIMSILITHNPKKIVTSYPLTIGTLNCRLHMYINQRNNNGVFHIELSNDCMDILLEKFDLNGLGFEYYRLSKISRIIVEDENQLRKMKLIGIIDILVKENGYIKLILTKSVFNHIQWKL